MQAQTRINFVRYVAANTFRGAVGGLKWSLAFALLFGLVLVIVQSETIAGAIIIQSMMIGIWVSIAATVGMIKGLTTFSSQSQ